MTAAETYDAVNAIWPDSIPPCTRREAERADNRKIRRGGHGGWHADLELAVARYVLDQGWLGGALRTVAAPKPTAAEKLDRKLEHARAMLAAKERAAKRATTLAKKWRQRVRYYERKANHHQEVTR